MKDYMDSILKSWKLQYSISEGMKRCFNKMNKLQIRENMILQVIETLAIYTHHQEHITIKINTKKM
jgi:hypothetical protein